MKACHYSRAPLGFSTTYGYNPIRERIAETNALGNATYYDYCACGSLSEIIDALGNTTQFTHDNQGNLVQTVYPDDYTVNNTYNLLHQQVVSSDSAGMAITNYFNNQGLLIASSNNVGRLREMAYDVNDLVTNSVDANAVSVNITHDNLHRLLTRSYPDGGVEKYGYSAGIYGPTAYTNQIGDTTFYGYDADQRKIVETNALGYVTAYSYSPASDLLTLTDGNGNTTKWGYDAYGRVTNKVDAAGNTLFVYKYDPNNRLTNRWSAAKSNTCYKYDAVGNLTNVVYPVSSNVLLGYDALNRLTSMVDGVGSTAYDYDNVGQLLSEDGPWPDDTVNYSYANRLRTGLTVANPSGPAWAQNYGYDSAWRLSSVTSFAGTFAYNYQSSIFNLPSSINLPNGAFITNQFDNVARMTGTWLLSSSGSNLDSYVYGYNQANQRTNVVRTAGDYVNYTYDSIGELYEGMGREANGTLRQMERFLYRYDAAGNLYQKESPITVGGTTHFGVNNLNEITNATYGGVLLGPWTAAITISGNTTSPATNVLVNGQVATLHADNTFEMSAQTVTNGINTFTAVAQDIYGRVSTNTSSANIFTNNSAYSYDLNGNLLTDGTRNFAYDDENELISVWQTNAWRNDFVYDGKMRRRIERDYGWSGSAWVQTNEIHFIYDGNLVVQERDANNTPQVTYTRGNDLSGSFQGAGGIGGLLARIENPSILNPQLLGAPEQGGGGSTSPTATAYYHADANGNIMAMINTSQMIVAKYLYDPYGNTLSMYGLLAGANIYRFSSKEWNANSEMYYYLYRFYDPNLQRWPNRDPLGEPGFGNLIQNTKNLRRSTDYGFVKNDPCDYVDAAGLTLYVCVRTAGIAGGFILTHAYFYNSATGSSCGRDASSPGPTTPSGGGGGPGPGAPGVSCQAVDATDSQASAVMQCCHQNANNGIFGLWPPGNNCHRSVNNCLAQNGLQNPGAPWTLPPSPPPPQAPPGQGCSICPINNPTSF